MGVFRKKFFLVLFLSGAIVSGAFGNTENDDIITDATELFNATKIVCSGISDEISKVSNISKVNTAVTGAGTVAAGGALAVGIAKSNEEKEIEALVEKICAKGGCSADSINNMSLEQFYNDVLMPMAEVAELQKKLNNSKKLGNWRTGLMAGTIGTNLASAIISGVNSNQSDLIQHIEACNEMIKSLTAMPSKLTSAGVSAVDNPIAQKISNVKTWCNQINTDDVKKIEKRMKGVMGTSIAGVVVGGVGTAVSATANSDKYMDAKNRINLSDEEQKHVKNLNTTANIMSGVNVGTGLIETGLNISLITLTKKMIRQAKLCEDALQ